MTVVSDRKYRQVTAANALQQSRSASSTEAVLPVRYHPPSGTANASKGVLDRFTTSAVVLTSRNAAGIRSSFPYRAKGIPPFATVSQTFTKNTTAAVNTERLITHRIRVRTAYTNFSDAFTYLNFDW